MYKVKITQNIKDIAKASEICLYRNQPHVKTGNNYTGLSEPDRYYNGYLGELAVFSLYTENFREAKYEIVVNGSDDGDIETTVNGNRCVIDVKTASKPNYKKMMIPTEQYNRCTYDYYIATRLNYPYVEILGYTKKGKFKNKQEGFNGKKVDTMYIDFEDLNDLLYLLKDTKVGKSDLVIPDDVMAQYRELENPTSDVDKPNQT